MTVRRMEFTEPFDGARIEELRVLALPSQNGKYGLLDVKFQVGLGAT